MANNIITPAQFAKGVISILNDVTKDIPEERKVEVQEKIINSFAATMFYSGGSNKGEKK